MLTWKRRAKQNEETMRQLNKEIEGLKKERDFLSEKDAKETQEYESKLN